MSQSIRLLDIPDFERASRMEDKKSEITYIQDSNVEILITPPSEQQPITKKRTDYWSIVIIAIIILSLEAWALLVRYEIL
jgi:hypothetical protein